VWAEPGNLDDVCVAHAERCQLFMLQNGLPFPATPETMATYYTTQLADFETRSLPFKQLLAPEDPETGRTFYSPYLLTLLAPLADEGEWVVNGVAIYDREGKIVPGGLFKSVDPETHPDDHAVLDKLKELLEIVE